MNAKYDIWHIHSRRGVELVQTGSPRIIFFKITDRNIKSIIDVIKSTMTSHKYTLDVYSGKYGVNLIIEVSGLDEERIRQIDFELSAKVLEICEKRNIEVHLIQPIEII